MSILQNGDVISYKRRAGYGSEQSGRARAIIKILNATCNGCLFIGEDSSGDTTCTLYTFDIAGIGTAGCVQLVGLRGHFTRALVAADVLESL